MTATWSTSGRYSRFLFLLLSTRLNQTSTQGNAIGFPELFTCIWSKSSDIWCKGGHLRPKAWVCWRSRGGGWNSGPSPCCSEPHSCFHPLWAGILTPFIFPWRYNFCGRGICAVNLSSLYILCAVSCTNNINFGREMIADELVAESFCRRAWLVHGFGIFLLSKVKLGPSCLVHPPSDQLFFHLFHFYITNKWCGL